MRKIDADALLENINNLCCDSNENWIGNENQSFIDHGDVVDLIYDAPTIEDDTPESPAEWVKDDLGNTYCSKCHKRIPYVHCYSESSYEDSDCDEWDEEIDETPYCMHCGAKMGEV